LGSPESISRPPPAPRTALTPGNRRAITPGSPDWRRPLHVEMLVIPRVQIIGVTGIPEVHPGDSLGDLIVEASTAQGTTLESGDIVVVTQKIVSKAEGRLVDLRDIEPSAFARQFAARSDHDPRMVELVLRESREIVRMDAERGILITETPSGFICANSGVDASNLVGDGVASLLPEDPDASAARVRDEIRRIEPGAEVAVIVSDTFGRAWREGHVNFAIGVAGMSPIKDYAGTHDTQGRILTVTRMAIADEIAAAAELVMGKATNVPVAVVRGYEYDSSPDGVASLIRDRSTDLFR
jgi:coenzyme F420-0:L-glutamate ligase/coenzyme F420-1:gamma-L-glutamate ligase